MSDLPARLRESIRACRALDRSQLLEEAAAEIERLRLTDAERDALTIVCGDSRRWGDPIPQTLLGLLRRLA